MMNSLSVLFRDRSSPSYVLRKLFELGAYANALDYLDCTHGGLAVFYNKIFISGSKFLSPSMKSVVKTWACAFSLGHLDFRLLMFGSHSQNQHAFAVSFISRWKFIFLFFDEAVPILS